MRVYPAIDIQDGRVARAGGAPPAAGYPADPVALAERFAAAGVAWLHLVDLDRAFQTGQNDALVRRITAISGLSVQMGGLLINAGEVAAVLELGAARAVVATAAAAEERGFETIARAVPASRLAVGIDVRQGHVAARGHPEPLPVSAEALARRAASAGITAVVYRDLDRDGALGGPDLEHAARLKGLGVGVIVAGGIASRTDLLAVRGAGLAGAIVGRALHEGRLSLKDALACSW